MSVPAGTWTVMLHRGHPDTPQTAAMALAHGATVVLCGPDCCEEDTVKHLFDDPDLTGPPGAAPPAEEHRGGRHPDWAAARPGEELPELPDPDLPGESGESGS